MKITRLTAENIKRLKAVEITPDGNLIVIGGRNAQGKTSVLDSITYALAGASSHPDQPIRNGEDKAKIVCELDDLIVTRTFTPNGGSLMVSNKEGAKYASPQAMLDELTGKLTFDPLAFARMQPREQLETLKSLVGLDFAEMDAKRQELYDERTLVNREGKKLAHQIEGMLEYPDAPDLEVSVSELMEELRKREGHNQANNEKRDSLTLTNNQVRAQASRVEEITEQIAQLETELGSAKGQLEKLRQSQSELQSEVTSLQDADVQEVLTQIAGADAINRKVRSNLQRARLRRLLDEKRTESINLSTNIQDIDEAKAKALSDATFPIAGLSFNEEGAPPVVTYNNVPFDQCSSSEQLRVSLAMGLAMNPKLKVVLIRDGSLLDKDNLNMIAEMAAVADAQVWLEKVGEGDDVSIIIEDGMVKE
jgi:DNA repair exonuclease SbcCD ATPase subunit